MYRGRGARPAIRAGRMRGIRRSGGHRVHSRYGHYYTYYYPTSPVVLIIDFALLVVLAIVAFRKSSQLIYEDPISSIKQSYINAQIVIVILSAISILGVKHFVKEKDLTKALLVILLINVLAIMVMVVVKGNLDNTYSTEKFSELFEETGLPNVKTYKKVTGEVRIDVRNQYINEQFYSYRWFNLKVLLCFCVNIIILSFNSYMIYKSTNKDKQNSRLAKDDAIIYEKINCRY